MFISILLIVFAFNVVVNGEVENPEFQEAVKIIKDHLKSKDKTSIFININQINYLSLYNDIFILYQYSFIQFTFI